MPSLLQRFARITPYFRHSRLAVGVAFLASLVGALTEPLIPAMLKPLLDQGFTAGALPLWLVPVAIIGVFALRGAARLRGAVRPGLGGPTAACRICARRCSSASSPPSRRCSPAIRPAA